MLKVFGLLLLTVVLCPGAEIIGYVFAKDAVLNPADIAAEKLTRINYAFANLRDGKVLEGLPMMGKTSLF